MLLQALRAGVVPRSGLHHVQVGRAREVQAIIRDIERVRDGGSAIRFVVGDYGSGKTFFLYLARSIALKQRLVTAHADLSPDRRLQATGGQARALYAALMGNLATASRPEGGALGAVVERFIDNARKEATAEGRPVRRLIHDRLGELQQLVSGHDFATAVERYHEASERGDDELKAAALRWLRGEYATKTEARAALGVRGVIEDASAYDHLKVVARFVQLSGYGGLLVVLDEMVNIYKIVNAQARNSNYEKILGITNDVLQQNVTGFGVLLGGTPEFLTDGRRGCYSYEPLRGRLAENRFAGSGLVDLSGPVLRLQSLTREELLVLLEKLRHLQAGGDPSRYLVPDAALGAFMEHCERRIGEAYFRTPRTTIKSFLDLLAILEQNPGTSWPELVGQAEVEADRPPVLGDIDDDAAPPRQPTAPGGDGGMATFRL
jgi:hypothetical protein